MRKYDSDLIQKVADQIYSSADSIINLSVLLGVLIGASAGYGLVQDMLGAVAGAVIAGSLGYAIGAERSQKLKFEVQLALCLAELEKNTRKCGSVA
jgi:hypothetical protein